MQWFHKTTALISLAALLVIGTLLFLAPTRQIVLGLAAGKIPLLDSHGKLDADTIGGKTIDQLLSKSSPINATTLVGHDGLYYLQAGNLIGTIATERFSAYEDLVAEGKIDPGSGILTSHSLILKQVQDDVGGVQKDIGGAQNDIGSIHKDIAGIKDDLATLKSNPSTPSTTPNPSSSPSSDLTTFADSPTFDFTINGPQISGSVIQSGLKTSLITNDAGFLSSLLGLTTDDLAEGNNLYYTQSRFNSAFTTKTTDNLTQGSSNLYSQWATALGGITYSDKVGIGSNAAPSATLDVAGSLAVSGALTLSGFGTSGGLLYVDAGTVSRLGMGSAGSCLLAGAPPTWGSCAATGGITGTGTAGQLAFFTGTSTESSDSNLVWDSIGQSLGVGTTTVKNRLDVKGGAAFGGYAGVSTAPANGFIVNGQVGIGTDLPKNKLDVNGGVAIGSYAGSSTAPNNGLIISGPVGIGQDIPTVALDVSGAGAFTGGLTAATINGLSITNNGTNTLNIAAGKTLTASNTLSLAGTDGTSFTFPSNSGTVCIIETGCGSSGPSANSLDFSELKDAMALDADTDIALSSLTLSASGTGAVQFNNTGGLYSASDLTMGADTSITLTGGTSFPSSPSEGQLFYRTDTFQLYLYANGKWQADRSAATKIVAASDSQNEEKADYVGDGTNDQTAINSAITALPANGGVVVLLDGTYNITGTVAIAKSNVKLLGSGKATILKRMFNDATSNSSGVITLGDVTNAYTGITLSSLSIDGNKASYTSVNDYGILFKAHISNSRVESSWISNNAGYGIFLYNNSTSSNANTYNSITNNDISSSNHGIYSIWYNTGTTITNNTIRSNTNNGIEIDYTADQTLITGNSIAANGNDGVLAYQNSNSTITSNTLTGNTTANIYSNSSSKVNITGNTSSGSANGIYLRDTTDSSVTSNNVTGSSGAGITLFLNSSRITVSSNNINNNSADGITVGGIGANNLISNNTISSNGGSGSTNGITVGDFAGGATSTSVMNNTITDTAGTGYAIYVKSTSTGTVLSNNTYSGTGASTISDNNSTTIYSSQLNGTDLIFKPTGNVGLGVTSGINSKLTFAADTTAAGGILFGSDTNLYRSGADTLTTDDSFQALSFNGLSITNNGTNTLNIATGKTLTVSNNLAFAGTDGTTFTFPSSSGTVCTVETGCGGGGVTANSLDFSELKDAMTLDASTSINIGGYDLSTTGSGALAFGHTGLTSFAGNVSLGANTTLQVTGGTAFPGTPAEGQMFFRTDTAQMYTYANGKWQADRSSVTKIVAAADSQNKEKADYVADGVGGVDDGSMIASAISALPSTGGTVVLLEGTFYIDSTLYIRKSHVALIGQGRSTRLLRQFTPADNSDNGVIYVAGPFQAYDDITISNLQIDGNKTNYSSTKNHGLYLGDSASNSTYSNLWIHDAAGRGINSPDFPSYTPYYNKIINNVVENSGAQGAYLNKFSYSTIQNNQFNTNGTVGLYAINSANSVISGNVARSNTTVGIDVYNVSSGTVVSNNTVSASGTNGIVLEANNITAVGNDVTGSGAVSTGHGISVASNIYKNISILDNTVTSSSGNGINVSSANGLISGNNISSNTGDGISVVTGVNNNQISNNYISANSGNGIYNYNNTGNQYTGNQVYNNTKHGIYMDAASINTTVSSNTITNNGGSSNYNGITLNGQSQNNHITDNMITDTAGTGYAIAITSATAVNTYLSNNTFSGTGATSISNSGSGTVLANQLTDTTSNNLIFNPQGNVGLGTASPTASLHIKAGLSSQLSGTFGVTFNTTSVTTSADQTSRLQVGDSITFGAYPNNNFTIAAITSTTITLGSTYFGSTTAASTGFTQPTNLLQVDNFSGSTVFSIGKTGGLTLKGDITLSNGSLVWTGVGAPGLSAVGTAKAYFDSTSNTLKLSENSGSYFDILSAGRALQSPLTVKTANYTLTGSDSIILTDTSSGTFTITLPSATGIAGKQFTIKELSASNFAAVNTTSSQTIDGATTFTFTSQYQAVTVASDGANWVIISKN